MKKNLRKQMSLSSNHCWNFTNLQQGEVPVFQTSTQKFINQNASILLSGMTGLTGLRNQTYVSQTASTHLFTPYGDIFNSESDGGGNFTPTLPLLSSIESPAGIDIEEYRSNPSYTFSFLVNDSSTTNEVILLSTSSMVISTSGTDKIYLQEPEFTGGFVKNQLVSSIEIFFGEEITLYKNHTANVWQIMKYNRKFFPYIKCELNEASVFSSTPITTKIAFTNKQTQKRRNQITEASGVFTIHEDGLYNIRYSDYFANQSALEGYYFMYIYINGLSMATQLIQPAQLLSGAGNNTYYEIQKDKYLKSGDTVEFKYSSSYTSGSLRTGHISPTTVYPDITITYIRDYYFDE